jgi:hypothetical protein
MRLNDRVARIGRMLNGLITAMQDSQ